MKRFAAFALAGACLFLFSCASKLEYVKINPRTSKVAAKIKKPLTICLENVPDEFEAKGNVTLKVSEYRRTVSDALKSAFQNSFSQVKYSESCGSDGLVLKVNLFDGYLKPTDRYYSGNAVVDLYAYAYQVRISLLQSGDEISVIDREIVGPNRDDFEKLANLYTRGLTRAIEILHEDIVVTPNLAKKLK